MADVFISYAREDRTRAEQVAAGLQGAGIEAFWDSEIPPGQTWADYIEDKLSNCKAVIVLWSANSTRSQWVREEARMGRDKGKLIPASLDDSHAPFGFGEVQAANLRDWQGQSGHPEWERMLAAVRSAVGASPTPIQPAFTAPPRPATISPPQQPHVSPPAPPQAAGSGKPWWKQTWVMVAGGVVGLLVVLGVIGNMIPDNNDGKNGKPTTEVTTPVTPAPTPPQPAPSGQSPTEVLQRQLAQATQIMGQNGFQPIGTPYNNSLAAGGSQAVPVTLQQGGDYRIVAMCDSDCTDIDLTLVDQNNVTVASDVLTDDHPIISIQPRWTGPFTVNIQMVTCNVAPCFYTAQLYGKPAG